MPGPTRSTSTLRVMDYGDDVNRWLNANQGKFDITRVLWREANHYDHLHVDLDPDHSGTPPCA